MTKPSLFQTATGPAVTEVQRRLAALGFYQGPLSGTYDAATAMAAVALQRQEKLSPVNGGFYQACWDALDRLEAKTAPAPPKKPPPEPPPKKPDPPKATPPKPTPREPAPLKPPPTKIPSKPIPREPAPLKPPPPNGGVGDKAHPYLVQSTRGPAVSDLQKRLKAVCLYGGPASGIYSAQTAGAVVALQKQFKISPLNGGMTPATWAALEKLEAGATSPPPPPGDGSVNSGPVQVLPPQANLFSNLRWSELVLSSTRAPTMQVEAPTLEGKQIYFVVDVYGVDGRWEEAKSIPATVKGGKASAALPEAIGLPARQRLRFRVKSAPNQASS